MTAFLSKLNGAEVAIDVDQVIEKKKRIEAKVAEAETELFEVTRRRDEESAAARQREAHAQEGADDLGRRIAERESASADHRSQIESLRGEIAAREQAIAAINEQIEAERRVQRKCEEQRDEARAEVAAVDRRYARRIEDAQKEVDRYKLRFERLRLRTGQMFQNGLNQAQRAQIADVKYAEQEARKAAAAREGGEEAERGEGGAP